MEELNPEGKKEVERLRKIYVISEEELIIHREQKLLEKMYECYDEMGDLLDGKQNDPHYILMGYLIKRLENHLQNNLDLT